jgi:hypothetical protein
MNIEELSARADKVVKLARDLGRTFPDSEFTHHLRLAVMAGLKDAYRHGQRNPQD